jgi:hypothetical protein
VIGGEFLADFSPGLGTFDNVLFEKSPNVNSYMFNLIAVAPFGHAHSYDPYFSGGIGVVTLNSDIFTVDPTRCTNSTHSQPSRSAGRDSDGTSAAESWRGPKRTGASAATCGTTGPTATTLTIFDLNNIGDGSDFTESSSRYFVLEGQRGRCLPVLTADIDILTRTDTAWPPQVCAAGRYRSVVSMLELTPEP